MKPIDPDGFEAKFRANEDPWNYRWSRFEMHKRQVLVRACGSRLFGRGLELACANGETTRALAARCLNLLAVDAAPTAVAAARRRTADLAHVEIRQARLPQEIAPGPFDLVVMSEIAYYLSRRDLARLLDMLDRRLAPGGRLVALHHVRPFDDAAQPPAIAHHAILLAFGRRMIPCGAWAGRDYRCVAFEKPRS
ncbi:nodulation S family protein [Aurantimonas sp. MSK8Z-1]|uniref:class I SAM-dependent methyltransferase n=1 Tax=Mangrovibrevibacter kandeliae TaxID=2968473 RepID=UPI0021176B0A|nr:methyltransferase [Aurantimonas sp. MSK8Z-1]MCW4115764.1 nodulation S family protein [Aurantimonas sp. MSK8Z-1]